MFSLNDVLMAHMMLLAAAGQTGWCIVTALQLQR